MALMSTNYYFASSVRDKSFPSVGVSILVVVSVGSVPKLKSVSFISLPKSLPPPKSSVGPVSKLNSSPPPKSIPPPKSEPEALFS